MLRPSISLLTSIILFFFSSCGNKTKQDSDTENVPKTKLTESKVDSTISEIKKEVPKTSEFVLTEENAVDFFFNYAKEIKESRARITTNMGSFTIQLYNNVPYHKANFIYLIKKGYFDNTQFHRIVKNFIIQGGNSDDKATGKKRAKIGRYLLPPDTRKGHKHHRGTISMPSSERDNPHKLASPYEFFIVVTKPGSYHLDGSYTPFGKVIEGMDIVDQINQVDVDEGDWPMLNVTIIKAEVF